MKKSFSLILVTVFILGCSPNNKLQVSTLDISKQKKFNQSNQIENVENFMEESETLPEIKTETQTFIDNCLSKEKFALRADICLSEYISYKVYDSKENIDICQAMHEKGEYRAKCFWYFAMVYQDTEICDQIRYSKLFENKFLNTLDCKSELSYKNEDAYWVLKKGIPYLGEGILGYRGNAVVKGWVEYLPFYVGDPLVAQLHISKESIESLPPSLEIRESDNFVLKIYSDDLKSELISQDIANQLEKYNEQNPATVKINAVQTYWEGSPAIGFVEILNN